MTGNYFLDWAVISVSLANVILLLWLGLTALLNAERRSWDVWLAGCGLLLGAAFFISHTAILGYGSIFIDQSLELWWFLGWLPVVMLPYAWYVMMLWYAGYWHQFGPQRFWLILTTLLLLLLIGLLLFATPLPSFNQVVQLQLTTSLSLIGVPILLLIYPLYVILCIGLSLRVLYAPAPSPRMMGDQARRRARPWLITASAIQLVISFLVAGVIFWVLSNAREAVVSFSRYSSMGVTIAWFDLLIAGLIGLVVIMLGQAIVSYAIFTGKALPHHELQRQWLNAIILAIGYGGVVGWGLIQHLLPIYNLLLTTILMTIFYALLIWRSYTRRAHYIQQLRPFVASQHLYEHLLTPTTLPSTLNRTDPFQALCQDILNARLAQLVPLGSLAPLVEPLTFPMNAPLHPLPVELIKTLHSPQTIAIPLETNLDQTVQWAIPLWSERGLIGLLLLGPKQDDTLYTQEELEIARASGERLIDTQASLEIARRLMTLQRQRLTESQLLDRQTRRVLHDDVLPQLHTALLTLSATPTQNGVGPTISETITLLTKTHQQISDLLHDIPTPLEPTLNRRGLIGALRQILAGELAEAFDEVRWQIEPETEQTLKNLPPLTAEVVLYALREAMRNSARHGRGEQQNRPLHLTITLREQHGLILQVADDGVGLNAIKSNPNEGGQGLALHSTMLAVVGGTLDLESVLDTYTRVTIKLPGDFNDKPTT